MSTREYAASIFNRLTDLQLEKFVALFADDSSLSDKADDFQEKREAFVDIDKIVKGYPSSDSSFEEIKNEYFREKYGL